ncbi:hypothetical protein F442_00296 [Phytophthora nicotianae P10297]|uniref:Uncharacterized protein n=2 Tax=Phytophthora nicotianae TaxID=4792 RepID=W2REM9_PHYN3|nr:hypothetical protein PPTG_20692 [Phytophthora nicotianae INRA-310]ETN23701.1 hypothetical protein PPTG_20692 [Phytophthora nicotianae INRA-310]ETP55133.1 hypothetical protein F442_00296 [Phytophthora nicotianae P10297]
MHNANECAARCSSAQTRLRRAPTSGVCEEVSSTLAPSRQLERCWCSYKICQSSTLLLL